MAALPRKSDPGGAASLPCKRARWRADREYGRVHRPRMAHFSAALRVGEQRRLVIPGRDGSPSRPNFAAKPPSYPENGGCAA
jgi:hypothetical protein